MSEADLWREIERLRSRLGYLEAREVPNQALDTTNPATFSGLNVGDGASPPAIITGTVRVERDGANQPSVEWWQGGQAADEKIWRAIMVTNLLRIGSLSDDRLSGNTMLELVRGVGIALGNLNVFASVALGGLVARTLGMARHTTANTAGNDLTLPAGGATLAATDKAGGNLLLEPGLSTGLGRGYVRLLANVPARTTGTTDNPQVDRGDIGQALALANNTVTPVASCTLANNSVVAGILLHAVDVFDGTDLQCNVSLVNFRVSNKGGVIANNATSTALISQILTAGTLTVTWTITAANPAVLSINANSSLVPSAGYPRVTTTLFNLTSQAVAMQ